MKRITLPRTDRAQYLQGLCRVDRLASRGKLLEAHSILVIFRLAGLSEFAVQAVVSPENLQALADWRGHHVTN